jgi:cytochrome c
MIKTLGRLGASTCLSVLLIGQVLAQSPASVDRGRAIAEQKCGRCHAIGRDDERPHAIVIPFRDLHVRYPIEMLVDAETSGVISGHDEMPMFELLPQEINALLSYIDSLAPVNLRYLGP